MYPEEIVVPMKEELTEHGFTELLTASEVDDQAFQRRDNSCNDKLCLRLFSRFCKTRSYLAVLNTDKKPDHLTTTFAGFDIEAVRKLREHLLPYPPSSPHCII
jgi:Protein of unknown function (DUF1094).